MIIELLISQLIGVVLAITLILSAAPKLFDLAGFQTLLSNTYGLRLPRHLVGAIPVVEVGLAGVLTVSMGAPGALLAVAVLFIFYTAFMGYAWASGRTGSCGCFGTEAGSKLGPQTLLRSLSFGMLGVVGAVLGGVATPPTASLHEGLLIILAALGLGAAALTVREMLRLRTASEAE